MGRFRTGKQWIGLLLLVTGVITAASGLPGETWTGIGERVALFAVSLRQPDEMAAQLSERLQRLPAAGDGEQNEMSVTKGEAARPTQAVIGAEQQPVNALPETVPEENGTGGRVVEQRVGGGTETAGISIKNKSGVYPDLAAALEGALPFAVEVGSAEPQVLICHTHATETYMPYDAGYYNDGDTVREPDNPCNVRAVGEALAEQLNAAGIRVLHDTTLHDYPQYRGAYERSAVTVQTILDANPSIKAVLDIHRDGLMVNATDKLKPTVMVEGQKAAQLMVVCGVLSTDSLPHPNWTGNLTFAAQLQRTLETSYGELARPLSLVTARYNQHLSVGSLLIEVGSEGNTLSEAVLSARLLGQSLVKTLVKE